MIYGLNALGGTGNDKRALPSPRPTQFPRKGLTAFIPAKSLSFSVTTTQSLASATAATIIPSRLRGRPFPLPSDFNRAQTDPAFASNEHASGESRLRPLGAGKPTLQLPALLSSGLLQYSVAGPRQLSPQR